MADKSDRGPALGGGPQGGGAGEAPGTGGAVDAPAMPARSPAVSAGWPGSRSPPRSPGRWCCCWLAG